jgi:phasin family protein
MPDDTIAPQQLPKAPANEWAANYATLLESNQQAFAQWMQGTMALSQEITRFTQQRLGEDVSAWWSVATCRGPEEAVACQQRFAMQATEQYAEEMTRLSQMMVAAAAEGFALLRQRPQSSA